MIIQAEPASADLAVPLPTSASNGSSPRPGGELRARQRREWERVAASVGDLWGAPSTDYYRRMEIALLGRSLGPLAGQRVLKLDLWNEAFNTRILHWMAEQGAEVYGLDVSGVVARRARHNTRAAGHPARLTGADIRELPFPDASFDAVYTMGTIEHIDEYPQAVAEVRRVLRPGGRAVVGVPFKWDPFLRPALVWFLEQIGKYPYAPEKSFGVAELREVLRAAGLEVRERTGILAIPGLLRIGELFLYTRRIPLYRLSSLLLWPFEQLESRFRWAAACGYLMTMVAERPVEVARAARREAGARTAQP